MPLIGDGGLWELVKNQYDEADNNVRLRLPSYAWAIDTWRGKFRDDEDYYSRSIGYDWFGINHAYDREERDETRQGIPDIYVREGFQVAETQLARYDNFFLSIPKPFAVIAPHSLWGPKPPSAADADKRDANLRAASEHLALDFHYHHNSERLLTALRHAVILGTGFVMNVEAPDPVPYPYALLQPLPPWDVLEDPLSAFAEDWRYCFVRQWVPLESVCGKYPGDAKELRNGNYTTDRYGRLASGMAGSATSWGWQPQMNPYSRKEVLLLHCYGWYDPRSFEKNAATEEEKLGEQDAGKLALCHLVFVGDQNGPTRLLLEAAPMDERVKSIPIEPLSMLRDPAELSCRGLGLQIIYDDVKLMNVITEAMLLNIEYLVNPGGYYNPGWQDQAESALAGGSRPGQFKPVPLNPGQSIDEVLQERRIRPLVEQFASLRAEMRQEQGRKTGVQDFHSGQTQATESRTLGEINLLMQEGNEIFRFRASRLDVSFKRIYRNHVLYSARAIAGYESDEAHPRLWYRANDGSYQALDTSYFDEPWEVQLLSGSTAMDAQGQVAALGSIMAQLAPYPNVLQNFDGMKIAERALVSAGIEPASIEKDAAQLAKEKQEAQAQAQAQAQASMGAAPSGQAAQMAGLGPQAPLPPVGPEAQLAGTPGLADMLAQAQGQPGG